MNLPGASGEVTRVSFDFAVTVCTEGGAEIRIETPCVLFGRDRSTTWRVNPASVGDAAVELVGLLHARVDVVDVTEKGVLSLRLVDGRALVVEPDEQFEAWSYVDRSGAKAVCVPGGGVTSWGLGGVPPKP